MFDSLACYAKFGMPAIVLLVFAGIVLYHIVIAAKGAVEFVGDQAREIKYAYQGSTMKKHLTNQAKSFGEGVGAILLLSLVLAAILALGFVLASGVGYLLSLLGLPVGCT